ncbi:DUF3592 domain-containing protein [Yoonia sp. SS1-5]|uniref:DUF3592 domain-containing protein n=2 Tax=Yoonia rhodophyticola TaxID=3137370 RepID=A0ABZ3JBY7_9RHOB
MLFANQLATAKRVLSGLLFAGSGWLFWSGMVDAVNSSKYNGWTSTTAQISLARQAPYPKSTALVRYVYEVDGVQFESSVVKVLSEPFVVDSFKTRQGVNKNLRLGQEIRVRYDQLNPSRTVMFEPNLTGILSIFSLSAFMSLAGIICLRMGK